MRPTAEAVEAAARRLRGHLVATPLVGGLRLPGLPGSLDLRLKLELLQPGGSVWYRGALHFLLQQLGSLRGLVLTGTVRQLVAYGIAGQAHRLPMVVVLPESETAGPELPDFPWEVHRAADPAAVAAILAQRHGFRVLPGAEDPSFAAGLATVGLELAGQLPGDCEIVVVPVGLAAVVEGGLCTGGHGAAVHEAGAVVRPGLGEALTQGHRVVADQPGLAALTAALELRAAVAAVVL